MRISPLTDDTVCSPSEGDGTSEDFADRIEEIDLLVALGQLVRRVLHLQCRLQILRHHRQQERHIAAQLDAGLRAGTKR
jgi:hypothetical protein